MLELAFALTLRIFPPGDSCPIGSIYIVSRGAAIFAGRAYTASQSWGEPEALLVSERLQFPIPAQAINYLFAYSIDGETLRATMSQAKYPDAAYRMRRRQVIWIVRRGIVRLAKERLAWKTQALNRRSILMPLGASKLSELVTHAKVDRAERKGPNGLAGAQSRKATAASNMLNAMRSASGRKRSPSGEGDSDVSGRSESFKKKEESKDGAAVNSCCNGGRFQLASRRKDRGSKELAPSKENSTVSFKPVRRPKHTYACLPSLLQHFRPSAVSPRRAPSPSSASAPHARLAASCCPYTLQFYLSNYLANWPAYWSDMAPDLKLPFPSLSPSFPPCPLLPRPDWTCLDLTYQSRGSGCTSRHCLWAKGASKLGWLRRPPPALLHTPSAAGVRSVRARLRQSPRMP